MFKILLVLLVKIIINFLFLVVFFVIKVFFDLYIKKIGIVLVKNFSFLVFVFFIWIILYDICSFVLEIFIIFIEFFLYVLYVLFLVWVLLSFMDNMIFSLMDYVLFVIG